MKSLARLSFLLVTVLWGSFYAVAKEALQRLDPIIFTFFEVASLVPIALAIIVIHRKELNAVTLKRGIFLGSWQCLALLTVTTAEQFTTATSTAFFPGIGGVIGATRDGSFSEASCEKSNLDSMCHLFRRHMHHPGYWWKQPCDPWKYHCLSGCDLFYDVFFLCGSRSSEV